jgi:hypothetical protein
MVSKMLEDLAKMLVYQNVFKPMFSAISGFATGGISSGSSWLSTLFGGGRMGGGPVQAGHVYAINEMPGRREYFIPHVGGNVVTDAQGGGVGGSGGNVTVNVHMNRDNTNSTDDTKADDRKAAEMGKRIAAVVKATIANEKRTGGLLDPTGRT